MKATRFTHVTPKRRTLARGGGAYDILWLPVSSRQLCTYILRPVHCQGKPFFAGRFICGNPPKFLIAHWTQIIESLAEPHTVRYVAERQGFEPWVQLLTVQRFSKPPP